ncbi:hypothetical protein D6783_00220 [Candidatus Woesearchaeota archaeon]|nr:MAG: hypothetical protein D6783_00220 [Candidatus Woesearchaeota archaeon]
MAREQTRTHTHHNYHLLRSSDLALILIGFLSLGVLRADLAVTAGFLFAIPYLFATKRTTLLSHLALAFFLAVLWMIAAKDTYQYNKPFLTVFGINTFPLFAWTIGLLALYLIYSHIEHRFHKEPLVAKLLIFLAIYWPLLIIGETIAYHVFNVRNLATAMYPGLPFCNCLHAPPWMQAGYFLLGLIFLALCYVFDLENPHLTARLKPALAKNQP